MSDFEHVPREDDQIIDFSQAEVRVPPTERGEVGKEQQSTWPTVVGIIALVLGVLAVFGACVNIGGYLFMGTLIEMVPEEDAAELESMFGSGVFVIASSAAWLLLSVALVVGAIGLMGRRAWAVKTCLIWAVVKIIYELAIIVPAVQMQSEQIAAQSGNTPMPDGVLYGLAIGGTLLGTLIGIALPIFLLIWLRRKPIQAEIQGWR